ncbi:unnamed protein product [Amoebophrya sp. A120]|nr:unnamed protein product [Amoebophrya sp. A120]|eukprot:GSA120T00025779001.1
MGRSSKVAYGKYGKSIVKKGHKKQTGGGLVAADLSRNKKGKVVQASRSILAKETQTHIASWAKATKQAKRALGLTGFVPVGGKSQTGQQLLAEVRRIYAAAKENVPE